MADNQQPQGILKTRSSPGPKKSVKVGFGGSSDEDAIPAKKKEQKKKEAKKAPEVEGELGVAKDIDHNTWLKRTQSPGVVSDEPWGIIKLTIQQARNVPPNSNKKCECFVKAYLGQTKVTTKIVKHANSPTWDETFEIPCEADEALKLKLFDNIGKGSRTADIPLGNMKIRLKNMKQKNVYEKWYDMKMDESIKQSEKIQLHISITLEVRPILTNQIHSKIFVQPTWVTQMKNHVNVEPPTAAEMRVAINKITERVVSWYNAMESFISDQRWKMVVLDVSLSNGYREIYAVVTYENRSRAPGQPPEEMEYETIDEDDEDEDCFPKNFKQLGFESFHTIIPKDIIKKGGEPLKSDGKSSMFTYRKRLVHYPAAIGDLTARANQYLTENRDLQFFQTSLMQTHVSNHVVVWFWM